MTGRSVPGLEEAERRRLEALHAYEILDSPPEEAFDALSRLASGICGVPLAFVTLVDRERQWFKARVGFEGPDELPREQSFCTHAIEAPSEVMVVEDAREDHRFRANPLVVGEPFIRFYAGAPIVTPEGLALGTVCVLDRAPRQLTEVQLQALRDLARQAEDQLELRRALIQLRRHNEQLVGMAEERTRRQAKLAHLAAIVESSSDAIVSMTPEGLVQTWNPGAERLYGYTAAEMVGRPIREKVPEERQEELEALLASIRAGDVPAPVETVRVRRTGERFDAEITASPILDSAGAIRGISWIVSDITARKNAEREAREAATLLGEQNEKLRVMNEAKTSFVSVVSHEFRTPLTVIQGFAEMLAEDTFPESQQREFARDIFLEASRLTRLITDMLDLDRMESGRLQITAVPLALNALVEDAARVWASQAERHRFEVSLDPALPAVLGEADRLRQVLTNLLSNAVKYSPDGGAVSIATLSCDGTARVSVRDEGIGVPPDMLERIFDRYARAGSARDREFGGTGLGLSISRRIVELHGGTLTARAAPGGRGTVFDVVLPAAVGAAEGV